MSQLDRSASMMPMRPRQHELEAQSRAAFAELIPARWSSAPRANDYGIDVDVEVFHDEAATGMMFGVQLKAKERVSRTPTVTIKSSTLRYWLAQDSPVLVCLWDAATSRMWHTWAHHVDPSLVRESSKTLTIKFGPQNEWSSISPELIEAELRARRAFRMPHMSLPVGFSCTGTGSIGNISAGLVVRDLRQYARSFPDIFSLDRQDHSIAISVTVGRSETLIELSGGSPKYLHYSDVSEVGGRTPIKSTDLATSVLVMIALQLRQANLTAEAARVIESTLDRSSLASRSGLVVCVEILRQAGRLQSAIDLVGLAMRDDRGALAILTLIDLDSTQAEAALIAEAFRKWAEDSAEAGDQEAASRFAYNSANRARNSDPELSVKMYEMAARLDPSYRARDYWWQEYGGALFLAGRPADAVVAYSRALELKDDRLTRFLLGDSLLFAGEYARAMEMLGAADFTDDPAFSEYRLKAIAVRELLEEIGQEPQVPRDPRAWGDWLDSDLGEEAARKAIRRDALCPGPLLALAEWRQEQGRPAAPWYLLAAFCIPDEAEVWLRALDSVFLECEDRFEDVARCARRMIGETLLDYVWAVRPESASALEDLFRSLPEEPRKAVVNRVTKFGSPVYDEL